jgi:signal transduction histidine kinase
MKLNSLILFIGIFLLGPGFQSVYSNESSPWKTWESLGVNEVEIPPNWNSMQKFGEPVSKLKFIRGIDYTSKYLVIRVPIQEWERGHSFYSTYADDHFLAVCGDKRVLASNWGHEDKPYFLGYPWIFFSLGSCKSQYFYLFLYSYGENTSLYNPRINTPIQILKDLAKVELLSLGINAFAIIIGIIQFVYWIGNPTLTTYFWFSQFSILLGLYGFTRLSLNNLLIPNGHTEFLLELFLDYSWPASLSGTLLGIIKESRFRELTKMIYYFYGLFIFSLLAFFVFDIHPYKLLNIFNLSLVILFITIVANLIISRSENPYFKNLLVGFSLCFVLAFLEILKGSKLIDLEFYYGEFSFLIFLITILITSQSIAQNNRQMIQVDRFEAKRKVRTLSKDLQKASDQLIQAEKLSSLGSMVSGIAHEINNPMNFIEMSRFQEKEEIQELKKYLFQLIPDSDDSKAFRIELEKRFQSIDALNAQIQIGVKRVADINLSMRNAARTDTTKEKNILLKEVIEESLLIMGAKAKEFQIEKILDEHLTAEVKRSQYGQIVMNLVSNAADALKERKEAIGSNFTGMIRVSLSKLNNDSILIVEDNGPGIALENRDKIMNAFFTTKKAGEGTGLGLAIIGKIIDGHNGSIEIGESELGGAKFKVIIPITAE